MEPVERVWNRLYITGIRLFLLFIIIALPFLLLALFVIKTESDWAYGISFILIANGVLWSLLGLFGLGRNKALSNKLSQLKAGGDSHEMTIKRMIPAWSIRLGGYITASVWGHYIDNSGDIHTVKSANYIFTTFDKRDDFAATVYVDPVNPKSYAVELLRKD